MARIRSVHPGLFTDEAFVSVSDAAQIFYIGLLTESDDQGVFEWKPVTLKMRLRPASLSPVDELLAELEGAQRIIRYEISGRHYGAIRNFRKFQRPKSPNALHPTTDDIRSYVGLSPVISEMSDDQPPPIPPNGEIPPQMEEVGGRREGKSSDANASAPSGAPNGRDDPAKTMFDTGVRVLTERGVPERQARSVLGKCRGELKDDGKLLNILLSVDRENPIEPLAYLNKAVAKAAGGGFSVGV